MPSYSLDIPTIDHERATDRNYDKLYNVGSTLNNAGMMAKAVPQIAGELYDALPLSEIAGELYDALPLSEIAAETIVPWQYKDYKNAMEEGREYKFSPSSFALDVAEMLPGVNAPVLAADVAESYMREGEDPEKAAKLGIATGTGAGLAEAIPVFGGKIAKGAQVLGKYGPTIERILKKSLTPTAAGVGIGMPLAVGTMYSEDEE